MIFATREIVRIHGINVTETFLIKHKIRVFSRTMLAEGYGREWRQRVWKPSFRFFLAVFVLLVTLRATVWNFIPCPLLRYLFSPVLRKSAIIIVQSCFPSIRPRYSKKRSAFYTSAGGYIWIEQRYRKIASVSPARLFYGMLTCFVS